MQHEPVTFRPQHARIRCILLCMEATKPMNIGDLKQVVEMIVLIVGLGLRVRHEVKHSKEKTASF